MMDWHGKVEEQGEVITTAAGGIKRRDYFYGIWQYKLFDTIKFQMLD